MIDAFKAIRRGVSGWYREPFTYVLLNLGWLILQIPIITGPAATAAMVAAAGRTLQGESISLSVVVKDGRRLFFPALKWGLLNGLIALVLAVNFTTYGQAEGLGWSILHAVWAS